jgi:hypothetical protein
MADYRTPDEPRIHGYRIQYHESSIEASPKDNNRRAIIKPKPIVPVEDEKYAEARKKSAESKFVSDVSLLYTELEDLLLSKHNDYGPSNISNAPGGALNGLRVRMHDKLARINNLVDENKNPEHESLEDSFKDMANYAIIGLLVLRGKWDK